MKTKSEIEEEINNLCEHNHRLSEKGIGSSLFVQLSYEEREEKIRKLKKELKLILKDDEIHLLQSAAEKGDDFIDFSVEQISKKHNISKIDVYRSYIKQIK